MDVSHANSVSEKGTQLELLGFEVIEINPSWFSRQNSEAQIKQKTDDQKNDQTTEKAKNHKTIWRNSTVLNPTFGPIYMLSISTF